MTQKTSEEINKRFSIGKLLDCKFLLFYVREWEGEFMFQKGCNNFIRFIFYFIPRGEKKNF